MAFSSRNRMAALLSSRYVLAAGLLAAFGVAQADGAKALDASGPHKKIEVQGSPTMARPYDTSRTSTLAAAARAAEQRPNFSAAGPATPGSESSMAPTTGRVSSIQTLRPAITGVSGGVQAASMATVSISSSSLGSRSGLISNAVLQQAAALAPGALSASTARRPGVFRTGAVVAAAMPAVAPRSSVLGRGNKLGATSVKAREHQHLPK